MSDVHSKPSSRILDDVRLHYTPLYTMFAASANPYDEIISASQLLIM